MKSLKLVSPKTLELVDEQDPVLPGRGEALIRVKAVGICGSDLHMYNTGAIGYSKIEGPFTLGHEFMGEVLQIGADASSGSREKLVIGQRVAVEPAVPCMDCELCETGHPNLCPNHTFYGVYPTQGALCEKLLVPARNCFPIPEEISDAGGSLLETLGVAIHSVDLAKLKIAKSVTVIGCGPVGLLIVRLAVLSGASPVYAIDPLEWRVNLAKKWGADRGFRLSSLEGVVALQEATKGRGVDVVFEAAWANESVDHAMDMAVHGGQVILVGIPPDDRTFFQHSTARRKGLTIKMVRRMKHTYPRAINLASEARPKVRLDDLISEIVPIAEAADAFERNTSYQSGVLKIVVRP